MKKLRFLIIPIVLFLLRGVGSGAEINWPNGYTVSGSTEYISDIINCGGNLTIPVGTALTLNNSTLNMDCATEKEFSIKVSGTLNVLAGSKIIATNKPYEFKYLANSTGSIKSSTIDGCYQLEAHSVEGIVIQNSTIKNFKKDGIHFNGVKNGVIRENTIEGCGAEFSVEYEGSSGIRLINNDGTSVYDNTVTKLPEIGIDVWDSQGEVYIYSNTITDNNCVGIEVEHGANAIIYDNIIRNNGHCGVYYHSDSTGKVYNNTITLNGLSSGAYHPGALFVYYSSVEAYNNTISNNHIGARFLWTEDKVNYFHDNTVKDNEEIGITIESASPIISENTISGSKIGISIQGLSSPSLGNLTNSDIRDDGKNKITNNSKWAIRNISKNRILAEGNDWGTTDLRQIDQGIYDNEEDPSCGAVDFLPLFQVCFSSLFNVKAYPNPCRTESVTFANLPTKETIKIFTISGELVKTLQKDDPGTTKSWNIDTKTGNRVASGIYIYFIESGNKQKFGKIAVIR